MAIEEGEFAAVESAGVRISRDRFANKRILDIARRVIAIPRRGTEADDHLSDDVHCQRKQLLRKIARREAIAAGRDPGMEISSREVVFFIFGHAVQRMMLGEEAEKAVWSPEAKHWYSPDGADVLGDGVFNEVKTTRRWPMTKAAREAGLSVERVIFDGNPSWFEYILGVMHHTGALEYLLTVVWVAGADVETFKIEATPEAVAENWRMLTRRREERRRCEEEGVLPSLDWRAGDWECKSCEFRAVEPCVSEIPGWR